MAMAYIYEYAHYQTSHVALSQHLLSLLIIHIGSLEVGSRPSESLTTITSSSTTT